MPGHVHAFDAARYVGQAIALLIGIAGPIDAHALVATADPAGPNEADRLFATAMSHWDQSTSVYVEQILQRVLALREAALPANDPQIALAKDTLGRVYYNRGIFERDAAGFRRAEALFADAATDARQSLGPNNLVLATYLGDLGASLREQGRYADAIINVCRSLAIRRSLLPANAREVAASLDNLSRIESGLGNRLQAAELQSQALRILQGTIGSDDPASQALGTFCTDAVVS